MNRVRHHGQQLKRGHGVPDGFADAVGGTAGYAFGTLGAAEAVGYVAGGGGGADGEGEDEVYEVEDCEGGGEEEGESRGITAQEHV